MRRNNTIPFPPLLVLASFSLVLLVVPFPGSLSVIVTESLASELAAAPGVEHVSEVALVVLAVGVVLSLVFARPGMPGLRLRQGAAVLGVLVAYGASEAIKQVFAQPRPCARWPLGADCPPPGDWSFPSNHATLAFAAVVVIAITVRGLGLVIVASLVAVLVCVGRISQGAHYLHDVAAGALLGIVIPLALVVGVSAVAQRCSSRMRAPGADKHPSGRIR